MKLDDEIRLSKKDMLWTNDDIPRFKEFMNETGFRVQQGEKMYEDINSIDKSQPFVFMGKKHTIQ